MKFCIERDCLKNVNFDFQRTLIDSIGYQKWADNSSTISYEFFDSQQNDDIPNYSTERMIEMIPVGSVGFVTKWLKEIYEIDYKPIQIPDPLMKESFLKRNCGYIHNNEAKKWVEHSHLFGKEQVFLKNTSKLKEQIHIIPLYKLNDFDLNGNTYFYSEVIDFISEYRIFVYKNEIVGIKHYQGDFFKFPDENIIKEMVKKYAHCNAPVSYTLDVGIHCKGKEYFTSVIEVHDFFSCGLYGFEEYKILPFMFSRWWYEYLNRYKNGCIL